MPRATETPSVFTLPNIVSTSRVALAIGFVAYEGVPIRLALIGIASLTDVLDGWLARRTRMVSRFGALLDPVADRFFVFAVVLAFLLGRELSAWQAIAIMFRDVMSIVGFFVARRVRWLRPIAFKARLMGKLVTGLQFLTFFAVLLAPGIVSPLVWLVGVLGLIATIDYTLMLWRERERAPQIT